MSAEGEPAGNNSETGVEATERVLSENVVESITVQEQGGSLIVSIPRDAARDLGISKGGSVLYLGESGDDSLKVGRPERVLDD